MPVPDHSDEFSLILAASVHDMKNSLGMLLTSLEEVITESTAVNARQEQQFATLQYEASRINGELIQLLSVYRMQKNRMPIAIDEYYVSDFLEDQLTRNETLFSTRGIKTSMECDPDLIWYFDSDLIASVINDALVNSSRYTRNAVCLSAQMTEEGLQICISDDGRGYPEFMLGPQDAEEKPSIYEQDRTNLGLYFATRVAAMHKQNDKAGYLVLANGGKLGGGEFILTLP